VLSSKKEAFILKVAGVVKDSPVVCKDDDCLPNPLGIDIAADFYVPLARASPSLTRPNLIGSVLYNANLCYLARDDFGSLTDCGFRQRHLGNHLRLPIIRQKPVQGTGSILLPCRWRWEMEEGAKLFSAPKFTLALLLAEAVEKFVQFLLQLLERFIFSAGLPFFGDALIEDLLDLLTKPWYDFFLNDT